MIFFAEPQNTTVNSWLIHSLRFCASISDFCLSSPPWFTFCLPQTSTPTFYKNNKQKLPVVVLMAICHNLELKNCLGCHNQCEMGHTKCGKHLLVAAQVKKKWKSGVLVHALIRALWRQRQEGLCEGKASLIYNMNFRPARSTV